MSEPEPKESRISRELLARVLERDRAKLLQIARRYAPRSVEPEDVVQGAFEKVLLHEDQFDRGRDFAAWLCTIVRNVAVSLARKQGRRREVSAEVLIIADYADDPAADPATIAFQKERARALDECVRGLTEESRALLHRWRQLDPEPRPKGWKIAELARQLGEPKETVRGRLRRVLEQLRDCIAAKGFQTEFEDQE